MADLGTARKGFVRQLNKLAVTTLDVQRIRDAKKRFPKVPCVKLNRITTGQLEP
jgi:hypothetical protein